LNKQKIVGRVFCDLKKVFDGVNHEIVQGGAEKRENLK
jgi:hypothetical protein